MKLLIAAILATAATSLARPRCPFPPRFCCAISTVNPTDGEVRVATGRQVGYLCEVKTPVKYAGQWTCGNVQREGDTDSPQFNPTELVFARMKKRVRYDPSHRLHTTTLKGKVSAEVTNLGDVRVLFEHCLPWLR